MALGRITVELPVDEAMFVVAALDRHAADAYSSIRRLLNTGQDGSFELDVAETTAAKSDAARKRIADALWPLEPESVEMGL